jgi:hypothetical protein
MIKTNKYTGEPRREVKYLLWSFAYPTLRGSSVWLCDKEDI